MILFLDIWLIEKVLYQPRLTDATWGDQSHIAAIKNLLAQEFRFLDPVTEILVRQVFTDNKGVVHTNFIHLFQIFIANIIIIFTIKFIQS
jgi:hypothetical protein